MFTRKEKSIPADFEDNRLKSKIKQSYHWTFELPPCASILNEPAIYHQFLSLVHTEKELVIQSP